MSSIRTSFVWQYMDQISRNWVRCRLCRKELRYNSSTSTMRKHMARKHADQIDTVTNHVKNSIVKRNTALEETIKKYFKISGPSNSNYYCTLCHFNLRKVKDTAHLMQHIDSKHPNILKALQATLTDNSNNENEISDEENPLQSDSDEDYVPERETRKRSSTKSQVQKSAKRKQGFVEHGILEKHQTSGTQGGGKRKTASPIWNFMTRVSPMEVVCRVCNTQFVFTGSTTTMLAHIKKKHPQEMNLIEQGGTLDLPTIIVGTVENQMKQEITQDSEIDNFDQVEEEDLNLEKRDTDEFGKKRRKLSSIVWNFLVWVGTDKTMCKLCKKEFKCIKGSTSCMLKHLKRAHPLELAQCSAGDNIEAPFPSKQASVSLANNSKTEPVVKGTNFGRPKFHSLDLLANVVVHNLYPSTFVENESFKIFAQSLNPRFSLPDKAMLEQTILRLCKQQRDLLEQELDNAPGVSISTEVWTYRERQQYMTVTVHFVSDTWDIQSAVLKTVLLDSRIDLSANIAISLEKIFQKWKLCDKIMCIVTNGTECMNNAMSQLNKPYMCCIAFALNTIASESLKASNDIAYLVKRIRDAVGFFQHSEKASENLKNIQTLGNKTPKKLYQDSESDWISTYQMFKSYLELQSDLASAIQGITVENILLVVEELELLRRCVQILEPFALVAKEMASASFTTLSKALPVLDIIKQMVCGLSEDCQDPSLSEFCSAMAFTRDLRERLEQWVNIIGNRQQIIPWAATFLDPRFKHTITEDPEMQQLVEARLQQLMDPNDNMDGDESHAAAKTIEVEDAIDTSLLWSSFDETIKKYVRESPVDEIQRYVDERSIQRQEDPFRWWMERAHLYPKLSTVVKQFLNIPATSVPPSQVFLEAEKRNLLLRNFIEESQLDSVLFLNASNFLL